MQNINKNISDRLNKLMETHNMTQRELAEALGVSQTAVFSWCSGQKTPRMDKVDKIADLFNVKRSYLLGLDNELGQMTNMMQESEQMRDKWLNYAGKILNEPHESTDFGRLLRIFAYASMILQLPADKQKQIADFIDYIIKKEGN